MLLQWAMGVTVFISCMGLLGLVIYTTGNASRKLVSVRYSALPLPHRRYPVERFPEIGGYCLCTGDTAGLVGLPPLDRHFAVRTEMSWWVFAASGLGMILLAFITLSIQTIRAARSNPINSLRTE